MTDHLVAVAVADAFMQFSQATVSAVRAPDSHPLHPRSVVHSFQLRAYEQGSRARLIEAEDDVRSLRHERDDALRDLNICKEQTRTWIAEVDRWKAEARNYSTGSLAHALTSFLFMLLRPRVYYRRIERCLWCVEAPLRLHFSFFGMADNASPLPPRARTQNKHQADLVAQLRQEAQQWKDQCLRLEETLRGEIKAWKDQFLRVDAEHTRLLSSAASSQVRPQLTL